MKTQNNKIKTEGKTSQEEKAMTTRILILEEQIRQIAKILEREVIRNQDSDERILKILLSHERMIKEVSK